VRKGTKIIREDHARLGSTNTVRNVEAEEPLKCTGYVYSKIEVLIKYGKISFNVLQDLRFLHEGTRLFFRIWMFV
jgi:hypothetical protein